MPILLGDLRRFTKDLHDDHVIMVWTKEMREVLIESVVVEQPSYPHQLLRYNEESHCGLLPILLLKEESD